MSFWQISSFTWWNAEPDTIALDPSLGKPGFPVRERVQPAAILSHTFRLPSHLLYIYSQSPLGMRSQDFKKVRGFPSQNGIWHTACLPLFPASFSFSFPPCFFLSHPLTLPSGCCSIQVKMCLASGPEASGEMRQGIIWKPFNVTSWKLTQWWPTRSGRLVRIYQGQWAIKMPFYRKISNSLIMLS